MHTPLNLSTGEGEQAEVSEFSQGYVVGPYLNHIETIDDVIGILSTPLPISHHTPPQFFGM